MYETGSNQIQLDKEQKLLRCTVVSGASQSTFWRREALEMTFCACACETLANRVDILRPRKDGRRLVDGQAREEQAGAIAAEAGVGAGRRCSGMDRTTAAVILGGRSQGRSSRD